MSDRVGWAVAVVLLVSVVAQGVAMMRAGPGFATLPIFVPVSLQYEQQLRAQRGQPAARGGEEAFLLAAALLDVDGLDPALRPQIEALKATRLRLLDARNRRHALNIALMDVGVAVATQLTPAQWDGIHMRRDAIKAEAEAAVFDRLLGELR